MDPLKLETVAVPQTLTAAESRKRYAARHPDRVAASDQRFRDVHGTARRNSQYLGKPFLAWDGEGFSTDDGKHIYNLFAGKCGDDTISVSNDYGLATVQIFETLLEFGERHPNAIHIIYGGSYDFNMWCSDMDRATVKYAYDHKYTTWKGYRFSWTKGKSFYVSRVDKNGEKIGSGVTVYDVVSFFQSSFVAACDSYLGDRFIHRDMIVANKAARGTFVASDLDTVMDYNDAELDNLILLANELRDRLNKVDLRPQRWDSCGAIATTLLKKHGIGKMVKAMDIPEEVQKASRFAYAGGRFELLKFGHTDETVYEYDINSAYPSALRDVPDLTQGRWRHVYGDPGPQPFAVYHITSFTPNPTIPAPLFRRDASGTVCYPKGVTGWYWSPEYDLWNKYLDRELSSGHVIEAWIFDAYTDDKPFDFIEPLYEKRRILKAAGDGSNVGIKLALNSLYGKLAQQVGAEQNPVTGQWRLPPFHCLPWAGFTTSHCRATILGAVIDDLDSVIAFETDAVFTTKPLDVKVSGNLGDFGEDKLNNLTYFQSGMYFADHSDGSKIEKTRGVDRGELVRDDVLSILDSRAAADRVAIAKYTRFITIGVALQGRWNKWRRWETMTKRITLEPTGKRIHIGCPSCDRTAERPLTKGKLHTTMCPMVAPAHSMEFPVVWANPNPKMSALEELRNDRDDWT